MWRWECTLMAGVWSDYTTMLKREVTSDIVGKEDSNQNTENHAVQKGIWIRSSELEIPLWKAEIWKAGSFSLSLEVKLCSALHSTPALSTSSSFLDGITSPCLKSRWSLIVPAQVSPGPFSSCAWKLSKKDTRVRSLLDSTIHSLCFWPPASLVSMHLSMKTGKGIHYNVLFIVVPIL